MGATFPFFLIIRCVFFPELPENWTDTRETILEGMTFNLRHLGMTLVDQPKGEDLSAAAVKRIVATVRTERWCHQRVAILTMTTFVLRLYNRLVLGNSLDYMNDSSLFYQMLNKPKIGCGM